MSEGKKLRILKEVLGDCYSSNNEILFHCPKCEHHKKKLTVNLEKGAYKCWVCDYRGRNVRRLVRRFGTYTQLQKWDQVTDRVDIERFADLFMERVVGECEEKVELPPEFLTLTGTKPPATA